MAKAKRWASKPRKGVNPQTPERHFRDGETEHFDHNCPSQPFITLRLSPRLLQSFDVSDNQLRLDKRNEDMGAGIEMRLKTWQCGEMPDPTDRPRPGSLQPGTVVAEAPVSGPDSPVPEPSGSANGVPGGGVEVPLPAANRRTDSRQRPLHSVRTRVALSATPRKAPDRPKDPGSSDIENYAPDVPNNNQRSKHVRFTRSTTHGDDKAATNGEFDDKHHRTLRGEGSPDDADADMADTQPAKPGLKLSFKGLANGSSSQQNTPQTPAPPSAVRTPSISLVLKKPSTTDEKPKPKPKPKKRKDTPGEATEGQKKKKRKSELQGGGGGGGGGESALPHPPPIPLRKLTFKNAAKQSAQTPSTPAPTLKLKTKGKKPKRPTGVGYDSELDEKEDDPYIFDAWVLRMMPGPDRDLVHKAIEEGKLGIPRNVGGANITMRALDVFGRRGILAIENRQYAFAMVDLPCIVEGMKSWDKKGWIKSVDISQMMLVLGRCNSDDEAKNYPLPEDVDPKNYQYAHGITAPMKWVRKRRFNKTKRARVDDIEAIERRVNALLAADAAAISSEWKVLDHDPRDVPSEDEDAEGESDDGSEEDAEDYFNRRYGSYAQEVQTPALVETPAQEIGEEDVDEFERMLAEEDDYEAAAQPKSHVQNLALPETGDSSFAVTSNSASPSATLAYTPASAVEASSDEDDDDDGDGDEDMDDAEKEGDEAMQQARDRIVDMESKIAEQMKVLEETRNAILKKKIARKIQDLRDDVEMMKKSAGIGGGDDDDEEDDDD